MVIHEITCSHSSVVRLFHSSYFLKHKKSERHFAQITRAERDFQKLANTDKFIVLQLSGAEP